MKQLPPKQLLFCQEYLIDLNATQAAIRAGYAQKTARQQGQRLLTNVDIKQRIESLRTEREHKTQIDAEFVLKQLAEFQQSHIGEILDDNGDMMHPREWPIHWQRMIEGFEVSHNDDGDRITKIKLMSKAKVMEMLGKHVDVGAFAERKIVEHKQTFSEILSQRTKHIEDTLH